MLPLALSLIGNWVATGWVVVTVNAARAAAFVPFVGVSPALSGALVRWMYTPSTVATTATTARAMATDFNREAFMAGDWVFGCQGPGPDRPDRRSP